MKMALKIIVKKLPVVLIDVCLKVFLVFVGCTVFMKVLFLKK